MSAPVDLSREKVLYVVATSHLDTQWRWTFVETIRTFIPKTLSDNFELFRKYPLYQFSFEGAYRYRLAKEYFPDLHAELKRWIATGRWHVCGSAVDAGDVNTVSPESLVRQVLYGNGFFAREYGVVSRDIFLPDCFGFGWALPSVAAHCGLRGFSTSKLEWGSQVGIPFPIGQWTGPDGQGILACLNPSQYAQGFKNDLSWDATWTDRVEATGKASGLYADYKYFGLGDVGGAPDEASVQALERSIKSNGPLKVVSAAADRLCRDVTDEQRARLPRHNGELLLIEHGVGTYTANVAMKQLNRANELMADAAERASTAAAWLGALPYPRALFEEAWTRFLANQMHDILPGTCVPEAYRLSENDEYVSLNQFASAFERAAGALARAVDTDVVGEPLVVINPSAFEREEIVEATVSFPDGYTPAHVRVFGPDGWEVPSQSRAQRDGSHAVVFVAKVPSMGAARFTVEAQDSPCAMATGLSVEEARLENHRYVVRLDEAGDIVSLYDKWLGAELLAAPAGIEFIDHAPREWPAWTIEYGDLAKAPRARLAGPARVRVTERGPARVAVEITRYGEGSKFVQTLSLAAGDAGNRLDIETVIEWQTRATLLKAAFPLAAKSPVAAYDLGVGAIERPARHERAHEVPALGWAAQAALGGGLGTAIFAQARYGWDKVDDSTLRLSLLHTPGLRDFRCDLGGAGWLDRFLDQASLDFGTHRFRYAMMGFAGPWQQAGLDAASERFQQPLRALHAPRRRVAAGSTFSFLHVDGVGVAVRAIKMAEAGKDIVVRVQQTTGEATTATLRFAAPVVSVRELNGMEESTEATDLPMPQVDGQGGAVVALRPWGMRTLALRLAMPVATALTPPRVTPIALVFNGVATSPNPNRAAGDFELGRSYPAEMLPDEIESGGVRLRLGSREAGKPNMVVCLGQSLEIPDGDHDRIVLLAASAHGDARATFFLDDQPISVEVPYYSGFVGQRANGVTAAGFTDDVRRFTPGFVKTSPVAWCASHTHNRTGNLDEPYRYCYLFRIELPMGGLKPRALILPNDGRVRIFAAVAVGDPNAATRAAAPLLDGA